MENQLIKTVATTINSEIRTVLKEKKSVDKAKTTPKFKIEIRARTISKAIKNLRIEDLPKIKQLIRPIRTNLLKIEISLPITLIIFLAIQFMVGNKEKIINAQISLILQTINKKVLIMQIIIHKIASLMNKVKVIKEKAIETKTKIKKNSKVVNLKI